MIFATPQTAYVVENAILELYDGVPSSSPLAISATPPTQTYRCQVTVSTLTIHTDCSDPILNMGGCVFPRGAITEGQLYFLCSCVVDRDVEVVCRNFTDIFVSTFTAFAVALAQLGESR